MNAAGGRFSMRFEGETLLGRYEVGEELGAGGMATVYLGKDTQLDMPVVVKVPHVALLADGSFRDRFQKEIQDLVALRHPHIVTILARGEHEEVPFLVQQYLEGGSLEDRLRAAPTGRLDADAAMGWIRDVAGALDFMHARGVVHRDVKPANVLFDEHGYVYLSDFGIAKAMGGTETGLTMTGATPGSPTYMAPEQARATPLAGTADQYALASTIFEVLTGRPPFQGETVLEVLVRKQGEAAPRLRDIVDALPAEVDDALARALERDPAARFDSCAAFAAALQGASAPAPRTPTPDPEPTPADDGLGTGRPDADVLPVTTTTGGPPAGGASTPRATQTFVVPDPAKAAPRKKSFVMSIQFTSLALVAAIGVGVFLLANRGGEDAPKGDRRTTKEGPMAGSPVPAAPNGAVAKEAGSVVGVWEPDWRAMRAAVAAGGPEAAGLDLEMLRMEGGLTLHLELRDDATMVLHYREGADASVPFQQRAGRWEALGGGRVQIHSDAGADEMDLESTLYAWRRGDGLVFEADGAQILMKRR